MRTIKEGKLQLSWIFPLILWWCNFLSSCGVFLWTTCPSNIAFSHPYQNRKVFKKNWNILFMSEFVFHPAKCFLVEHYLSTFHFERVHLTFLSRSGIRIVWTRVQSSDSGFFFLLLWLTLTLIWFLNLLTKPLYRNIWVYSYSVEILYPT